MSEQETLHYAAEMSPDNLLERLRKLLAEPPLKLSVEGGGLPDSPQSLVFDAALLIDRLTAERLAWNLERMIADREARLAADAPHVVTDKEV